MIDLKAFQKDFRLALEEVEAKYNVSLNMGTITYNDTELRFKVVGTIGGTKVSKPQEGNFKVGDKVGIDHKKINPTQVFIVTKVNRETVQVKDDRGKLYKVTASLLFFKS